MKFLLKIFVFMAILLISKFTSVEPAGKAVQVDARQPKTTFVNYLQEEDSTALKLEAQEYTEAYN